jgi:hypothetical protein
LVRYTKVSLRVLCFEENASIVLEENASLGGLTDIKGLRPASISILFTLFITAAHSFPLCAPTENYWTLPAFLLSYEAANVPSLAPADTAAAQVEDRLFLTFQTEASKNIS